MPDEMIETLYSEKAEELMTFVSPYDMEEASRQSDRTLTKLKLLECALRLAYHHGHGDGLKEAAVIIHQRPRTSGV